MLTGDHLRDLAPLPEWRYDMPEMAASDPAEPLPTWPRHDPATGFGLALIAGAVVVACVVAWRWRRG